MNRFGPIAGYYEEQPWANSRCSRVRLWAPSEAPELLIRELYIVFFEENL